MERAVLFYYELKKINIKFIPINGRANPEYIEILNCINV